MSRDDSVDFSEDSVDPRVQVELERLNVATDEINRLEVDLDEARNVFRSLLSESSSRIEGCSKKLGHCIPKARPYYDSRLKAKEALRETQKMAAKFERANSAHAAAKEMVFLAEEGLKAEGRTFDHAWQEMLNHATMRVNESEAERTVCEAEHKRASHLYQMAEIRVQTLQRTLKKAITKSRPYFELKIQYNHLLEEQKKKVKDLEKRVTDTKMCYADTLRNLEQISDEIHQSRHYNRQKTQPKTGEDSDKLSSCSRDARNAPIENVTKTSSQHSGDDNKQTLFLASCDNLGVESGLSKATPTSGSSIPDTDIWSETSDAGVSADFADQDSDSSLTGIPDSESDDDIRLAVTYTVREPDVFYNTTSMCSKIDLDAISQVPKSDNLPSIPNNAPTTSNKSKTEMPRTYFEGIGICSFPIETDINTNFEGVKNNDDSQWTEIKLSSSGEEFATVKTRRATDADDDFDIPYAPLSEIESELTTNAQNPSEAIGAVGEMAVVPEKSLASWITANIRNSEKKEEGENSKCMPTTPRKMMNIRRQSLDVLWNTATGEKMKEILSQSILKLNIGSLNERRSSESKVSDDSGEVDQNIEEVKGGCSYESNLSSQFGLQFFSKKPKSEDELKANGGKQGDGQENSSGQGASFMSRKDKFFTKKVPSPLERTLSFLTVDDDSTSDTDSLPSVDMLTDEQLSALVLDQDLSELYQDILQ